MKTLILLTSLILSTSSFAGPGHDHSHGSEDKCKKLATGKLKTSSLAIGRCHISRFIKSGKINSSWKNAKHVKSVKKKFKSKSEWVVSFNNEKGVKGKTLYFFLNTKGGFIAANFTGK